MLICRVAKNLPVLELLNHFIKSSTVAYQRVAYKKNLVHASSNANRFKRVWVFLMRPLFFAQIWKIFINNYLYTVQVTIWSKESVFKIWLIRLLVKTLGDFFLAWTRFNLEDLIRVPCFLRQNLGQSRYPWYCLEKHHQPKQFHRFPSNHSPWCLGTRLHWVRNIPKSLRHRWSARWADVMWTDKVATIIDQWLFHLSQTFCQTFFSDILNICIFVSV